MGSYRVLHAHNGRQAMNIVKRHHIDVVLLDLNLPDADGFRLLGDIQAETGDVEVIIITAHADNENAIAAVKQGAFHFFAKTYDNYRQLDGHIQRALMHRRERRKWLADSLRDQTLFDAFQLMNSSRAPAMQEAMRIARRAARAPFTVLLEGESGVGKEIMARYIHAHSERREASFVAVHIAAQPATLLESNLFGHVKGAFTGADRARVGKFELADSGTLFLDEIGEIDADAQVKLLRVLQERTVERVGAAESSTVDVRLIAATNKTLRDEVAAGRFREDLFYRLNVIPIVVPPLRERKEDLPALLALLMRKHAMNVGREVPEFSAEAMMALQCYDWPGNVREAENFVMRLIVREAGPEISLDDIPTEYRLQSLSGIADTVIRDTEAETGDEQRLYFLARDQFERYLVKLMINRCQGDKRAAARALGVSYSTVKEKSRGSGGNGNGTPSSPL
ncbi:MAG: sigma-54 dependent transcriptional regulator [Haliangiales bacterium]